MSDGTHHSIRAARVLSCWGHHVSDPRCANLARCVPSLISVLPAANWHSPTWTPLAQSPSPAFEEMQKQVSALGEPFLCGFDPGTIAAETARCGFELIEDLSGTEALARYGRSNDPASPDPALRM